MDKTLLKGLKLLEVLARSDGTRGISDLAEELGLVRSNVHRLLQTFVHSGYVLQDPATQRYKCTLLLWELGAQLVENVDVRHVAQAAMRRLADATLETVHLAILEGTDVLYLDKIDSPQPVRAYTRIGGRAPAYCVATGKVLLACATEAGRRIPEKLVAHTKHTLVDRAALNRELARVREQGYSVNRGEWREGVCGVGAPVFDASGKAIAAVGISGPAARFNAASVRKFAPLVIEVAASISADLGYRPR